MFPVLLSPNEPVYYPGGISLCGSGFETLLLIFRYRGSLGSESWKLFRIHSLACDVMPFEVFSLCIRVFLSLHFFCPSAIIQMFCLLMLVSWPAANWSQELELRRNVLVFPILRENMTKLRNWLFAKILVLWIFHEHIFVRTLSGTWANSSLLG